MAEGGPSESLDGFVLTARAPAPIIGDRSAEQSRFPVQSWRPATTMRLNMLSPIVALAVAACASGSASSSSTAARSRDLITVEEMRKAGAANAYDLITTLRPNWLNIRGEHSFRETARTQDRSEVVTPGVPTLVIYLDNARLGGAETLRQVLVPTLMSVQYFDAKAATFKWGAGHSHGAILVSTAAPPPVPPR